MPEFYRNKACYKITNWSQSSSAWAWVYAAQKLKFSIQFFFSRCYYYIYVTNQKWNNIAFLIGQVNAMVTFTEEFFNWKLHSLCNFKHSSQDSLNPICRCGNNVETCLHLLLHYFKIGGSPSWVPLGILVVTCWTLVIRV